MYITFPQTVSSCGYTEIMNNKTKLESFGCDVEKMEVIRHSEACIMDRFFSAG